VEDAYRDYHAPRLRQDSDELRQAEERHSGVGVRPATWDDRRREISRGLSVERGPLQDAVDDLFAGAEIAA